MTVAVLDLDFVKYKAAAKGEVRSIHVVHNRTGNEFSFDTRIEFWGADRKHSGGWLAERNSKTDDIWLPEEFTITDIQTPQPIAHTLHTAKRMVEKAIYTVGASYQKSFIGKGDSFRVDRSTLLKYKGQRAELLKPLAIDDVVEYLTKKFKPEIVYNIESDDACVIECFKKKDHVLIGADKDFFGCPVNYFNVDNESLGILNCNQFGKLWIDAKKEVRGIGRLFFYFQMCSEDAVDNYKANCVSDVTWGKKSAYNALVNSSNDREALSNIVNVFKTLYPEPKVVQGWRGDNIEIDWLYVATEMFDLARMLKVPNEVVVFKDVLDKLGVEY